MCLYAVKVFKSDDILKAVLKKTDVHAIYACLHKHCIAKEIKIYYNFTISIHNIIYLLYLIYKLSKLKFKSKRYLFIIF